MLSPKLGARMIFAHQGNMACRAERWRGKNDGLIIARKAIVETDSQDGLDILIRETDGCSFAFLFHAFIVPPCILNPVLCAILLVVP